MVNLKSKKIITKALDPGNPSHLRQLVSVAIKKLKNNSYVKMEVDNERKLVLLSSKSNSQLKKIEEEIWDEIKFITVFDIIEKEK